MKIVFFVLFFILAHNIKSQNSNHSFHLGLGLKYIGINTTIKNIKSNWPTSTISYSIENTENTFDNYPSLEGYYQYKYDKLLLQSGLNVTTNFDSYLFELKQRFVVNLSDPANESKLSFNLVIPELSLGKMLIYENEQYVFTDLIFLFGSGICFNFSDKISLIATYSSSQNRGFYSNSYGIKENRYEKKINRIRLLNLSFFMKL